VRFVLQLQGTAQAVLVTQMPTPPFVDPLYQVATDAFGRLVRMRPAQPDERRVGVAVDHHMALGLYQFPRAAHDLVATQSDRGCQPGVEEAATTGAEHPVEGIHDDFQRL